MQMQCVLELRVFLQGMPSGQPDESFKRDKEIEKEATSSNAGLLRRCSSPSPKQIALRSYFATGACIARPSSDIIPLLMPRDMNPSRMSFE